MCLLFRVHLHTNFFLVDLCFLLWTLQLGREILPVCLIQFQPMITSGKPTFSSPYQDYSLEQEYMVTGGVPVYIGGYPWGTVLVLVPCNFFPGGVYADVSFETSQRLTSLLTPGFAILMNADGVLIYVYYNQRKLTLVLGAVLLGNELAFRKLFNKSRDITANYLYLTDSPFGNMSILFNKIKQTEAGVTAVVSNFDLAGVTHTIGYYMLKSLEGYGFVYFVPTVDISFGLFFVTFLLSFIKGVTIAKQKQQLLYTLNSNYTPTISIKITSSSPQNLTCKFTSDLFLENSIVVVIEPYSTQDVSLAINNVSLPQK